jgi:2-aminophenol/2-amino-5-chlorophenol 1,6-dioxygenase alpha subunit
VLSLMEQGKIEELLAVCPDYAAEARVDMGFKHLAFLLGAMGGSFSGATVHGYGPLYGAGGAVVEFRTEASDP